MAAAVVKGVQSFGVWAGDSAAQISEAAVPNIQTLVEGLNFSISNNTEAVAAFWSWLTTSFSNGTQAFWSWLTTSLSNGFHAIVAFLLDTLHWVVEFLEEAAQ